MSSDKIYKANRFSKEEEKDIGKRFQEMVESNYENLNEFLEKYNVKPRTYKNWRLGISINIPTIIKFCKDHPHVDLKYILIG